MSELGDLELEEFIAGLHGESSAQEESVNQYFERRADSIHWGQLDEAAHRFLADKLVALDRDKAMFCHRLCLALRAQLIVEVGTSHGVSTLYLAQALRRMGNRQGRVIATEYEPTKAAQARNNFERVGLGDFIELREGDLRHTLRQIVGRVDFVLMDIWEMARPAIELLGPHLHQGAVIVTDNTAEFPENYYEFFEYINDPRHGFSTQTLPFAGGLEFTIKL